MPAAGTEDFLKMSMRNAVAKAETNKQDAKRQGRERKHAKSSSYDPLDGDI
jgi:hypothetical protein